MTHAERLRQTARDSGHKANIEAFLAGAEALDERDEALAKLRKTEEALLASENFRRAYQDGKGNLYAMGGIIAEAAMQYLPCNEGGIDRFSARLARRMEVDDGKK